MTATLIPWAGYLLALALVYALYHLLRSLGAHKRQIEAYEQEAADRKRKMIEKIIAEYEETVGNVDTKKGQAAQTVQQYLESGDIKPGDPLYQSAAKLKILPPKKKAEVPKWLVALLSLIFVLLMFWLGNKFAS
jgi:hypothetical protein